MLTLFKIVVLSFFAQKCSTISDHPLVLLISLDGLRYDFVTESNTPNIWHLAKNGVFAVKGIKSQMTTVTAANHMSIVTGLYEESHGIIDNQFYDPVFKEHYDIWNFSGDSVVAMGSKKLHWYENSEPIWRTNMQSEGRYSGSYLWPMGDVETPLGAPKHKVVSWYDDNDPIHSDYNAWTKEIDHLLAWYVDEAQPINLGLYYNEQPDHDEHSNDIFGINVTKTIQQLDQLIGYLVQKCKQLELFDRMNFILTADHGHAVIKDKTHMFTLTNYITPDLVIRSSYSLFPRTDKNVTVEDIYKNVTRAVRDGLPLDVWRKSEFPHRYHWKNHRRVGPVITVYKFGYQTVNDKPLPHGTHGFLNDFPEMNPFFVAYGPSFKKGFTVETDFIQNIDIYPLMCHILGIKPAPNNGSLARISVILIEDNRPGTFDSLASVLVVLSIVLPCVTFLVFCFTSFCDRTTKSGSESAHVTAKYQKLPNKQVDDRMTGGGNEGNSKSANVTRASAINGAGAGVHRPPGNKPLLLLEKEGSTDDEL